MTNYKSTNKYKLVNEQSTSNNIRHVVCPPPLRWRRQNTDKISKVSFLRLSALWASSADSAFRDVAH